MNNVALAIKPAKRTRAEIIRDKIKIRLALDETGPLIAEILKENGIELSGCDWNRVFPSWLIATVDDEVIGCIQVMPAKPLGWCQFLYVKPSASFKMRAIALRKLAIQGASTLYHYGSDYVTFTVDVKNKKFYDVLKKFNVVQVGSAMHMAKRLR